MSAAGAPVCVVIDLDDTMFLERDYVKSGFDAVGAFLASHDGIEGFAAAAWEHFEQGLRGNTFDVVLTELDVKPSADLVAKLVEVYRSHEPKIEMLPDARAAIDRLRPAATLAVITDGPLESQQAKARAMGAPEWAELIVYTAEFGAGFSKPHARAFELVEQVTGAHGASCSYLADNPTKDFVAPRALGWHTVRVRRSASLHASIDSGADVDAEVVDVAAAVDELTRRGALT